jgi:uncharacterized delta-60 repeat protein
MLRRARNTAAAAVGVLAALSTFTGPASAAPGDLDRAFSGDGKQVFNLAVGGHGSDIAVDPAGKIVVVGTSDFGATLPQFAIARYLPTGELDANFGFDGGQRVYHLNDPDGPGSVMAATPEAVAVDRDGNAYMGGWAVDTGGGDTMVAIVKTHHGFAPEFFVMDLDPANDDEIHDLTVDSSGRIVATGQIGPAGDSDALTLRLTPQLALDTSFSPPDGFASLNASSLPSDDWARGVTIDSLGRIVIAGTTSFGAQPENFMAARYLESGALDPVFSSNPATIPGRSIVDVSARPSPNDDDGAEDVVIASGDRPLMAGFAELSNGLGDMALLQLTANGSRDNSFGSGGTAFSEFGHSEFGMGLTVDRTGRPVMVGQGVGASAEFGVTRWFPNGFADPGFGQLGVVSTDFQPGAVDAAEDVAVDSQGRLVVIGTTGTGQQSDWAIARYEGVPRCGGRVPTITGTPGRDTLKGTRLKDVISGGAGDDTIKGFRRGDRLCGEGGRDRLYGGKGNDRLYGGKGRDRLFGGKGQDRLKGGKGKDRERQ